MNRNIVKIALVFTLAAAATALSACKVDAQKPAPEQPQTVLSADDMLASINDQMGRMNYGEAVRLAVDAQTKYPGDYRIHTAAARAQAKLNDPVAAADALERAVSTGLPDLAKVLAEPVFDNVRSHSAFAKYRSRATAARASRPRDTTNYIRAGDVEIIESTRGDVIRAGDLVLDTRH